MIIKAFLVFLILLWPHKTDAQNSIKGVIGDDDRQILRLSPQSAYRAVGRVNIAGFKNKSLCTGTLIMPDKVITAAHCLFNPRTKRPHPIKNIHFVAGKQASTFAAHGKAKKIDFLPEYKGFTPSKLSDFAKDIAVITLEKEMPIKPLSFLQTQSLEFLNHIMYARDRPHRPSIHKNCKILQKTDILWLTDCDTNFGGSGGPVFTIGKGGPILVAVMVGILPAKASVAIPVAKWHSLLEEN